MKNCLLIIDGGTTNTRFTLFDQGREISCTKRKVGACDTVNSHHNSQLEEAVRLEIEALQRTHNCCITDVYAAGMITSNAGLREISHLQAPTAFADLANAVETHLIESVSDSIRFHFIPGIKVLRKGDIEPDIIRGEESEIFGALLPAEMDKSILFVHFGSHNKMIHYEHGAITSAITTLSGELLWAICKDTILKSSVVDLDEDFELVPEYVREGYWAAQSTGFSRSLFLARITQVLEGYSRLRVLSFVFGILVYSDMEAFEKLLKQPVDSLVLYGRDSFISAFCACLDINDFTKGLSGKLQIIPFEESQGLSIKGILRIQKYLTEKKTNKRESNDKIIA